MRDAVLTLRPGANLWFDGRSWTVCEVEAKTVRLRDSDGGMRVVPTAELMGAASQLDGSTAPTSPSGADLAMALASVPAKVRDRVAREVRLLSPILEGHGEGDIPATIEAVAGALGVSVRTAQRRLSRLQAYGPGGLVDTRLTQPTRRSVDPRWDQACLEVLHSFANVSNPTRKTVIALTNKTFRETVPDGTVPSMRVAYRRVDELDKGKYTFGEAKQRRSVAKRPQGVLGQLRPSRPGQYVLLDGYKLDVFAMEPVTMRWVNTELTVALDLYARAITGIRLRPVAAKSADVASVLYQTMTPQVWGQAPDAPSGPYAGVPEHVVLGEEGMLPDTIVIDHGKVYVSEHTASVCRRLGISIQPAIPNKPTDKPALERFFRTLRQSLMDKLPGYKGPNIASRGDKVEAGAFYYVSELEQLIREWVGIYHAKPHEGLCDPRLPDVALSPNEMFNRGIQAAGRLRLPDAQQLFYEFLHVEWRTIQHYGVEIHGRRYDGAALNMHRGRLSGYGGVHAGKWPFMVDVDDVRHVHFQDPDDQSWHRLEWSQASGLTFPFSADAADYTRRVSTRTGRHVDPEQAIDELLQRWSTDTVHDRRDRNLAIRLATQRAESDGDGKDAVDLASLPGVIDLVQHRQDRATHDEPTDDVDVFERYYVEHPDEDVLEVFDE